MKVGGRVTERESQESIQGALIRLVDHEQVLVEGITDSDGRYSMTLDLEAKPHLRGRPGQVKASKEGFEPAVADFDLADGEFAFDLRIHGRPETLEILVNQLDGSPLQGAEVLFTMGKAVLERGTTDEHGLTSWVVPPHRLDQQALLKLSKPGWFQVERLVLLRRDQPRVQVTLERSDTEEVPLSGRVLDEAGRPVGGVRVELAIPGLVAPALTTDAEGRWSLTLDGTFYGGEGLLQAEHPDYHPARDVKLPLMPNAMHIVPLSPLKAPGRRVPWPALIGALVAILAAVWLLFLRG